MATTQIPKSEPTPEAQTTTATPTVVVTTAAQPVNPAKPQVVTFESTIENLKKTGTPAERTFITQIEDYMEKTKPNLPITQEAGAKAQTSLWRAIRTVVEKTNEEFPKIYSLLLAYFDKYKDTNFHEHYIHRFTEMMTIPSEEITAYELMINLIKVTAAPATRSTVMRQVDLSRTLKNGFTETGKQNILAFYGK